ncbi:OmpP1/FadL family transporter [Vibrio hyugaensis]|uniref:OmpP1/FadL family transporter n=1 Tax=Vibrio hyugaensis TaxID=1534743 RepID=UPI0005EE92C8|nr:outer membrane protein transport protein [Vibrio hyugaensis]
MNKPFSLSLIASGLLFAFQANAAGTLVSEMSQMSVSTAGADGGAVAENASVAFSNPAGMSYLDTPSLSINLAAMALDINYDDNDSSQSANDAGGFQPYGSIYYVQPLSDKIHVGMSFSAQGGSALDYGTDYAGKMELNDLRLSVLQFNPSLSYQINPRWSVGMGLQIDYATYEQNLLIDHAHLETDSWTLGYNLGAMFQIDEDNRLGLAYRSEMNHDLTGKLNTDAFRYHIAGPIYKDIPAMSGQAGVTVLNPRQLELSGLHQITTPLSLVWSLGFEQWSKNKSTHVEINDDRFTQIPRNFEDVWSAAVGARYQITSKLRLEGGVGYASSPLDDASIQSPDLPVDSQHRYSIGMNYQWSPTIDLSGYYSYVDYGDPDIATDTMQGQFDNQNQFFGLLVNMAF